LLRAGFILLFKHWQAKVCTHSVLLTLRGASLLALQASVGGLIIGRLSNVSFFVDPEWLDAIRGKIFFYPAAGCDWREPFDVFADHIDTFWFADINYCKGLRMRPVQGVKSRFRLLLSNVSGEPEAAMEWRDGHRSLLPSRLHQTYECVGDGRRVTVVRRRGFGQYALSEEFADGSIGVFMHRGDSPGEGGSNTYYLANMRSSHKPLSNLFDKLSRKLANRALIVSDGSNCDIKEIRKWHLQLRVAGFDAFKQARAQGFDRWGWSWKCVGYLGEGYRPTFIWGLTRLEK
jgi:hypothetical protein